MGPIVAVWQVESLGVLINVSLATLIHLVIKVKG